MKCTLTGPQRGAVKLAWSEYVHYYKPPHAREIAFALRKRELVLEHKDAKLLIDAIEDTIFVCEGADTDREDVRDARVLRNARRLIEEGSIGTCIGKNPGCPCQDGLLCHYLGENPWPIPQ